MRFGGIPWDHLPVTYDHYCGGGHKLVLECILNVPHHLRQTVRGKNCIPSDKNGYQRAAVISATPSISNFEDKNISVVFRKNIVRRQQYIHQSIGKRNTP